MGESWAGGRRGRPGGHRVRAAGLLLVLVFAVGADGADARRPRTTAARRTPSAAIVPALLSGSPWLQVDRFIAEQRLQDAVKLLQRLQRSAQVTNREPDAIRAAVRLSQVRMTLSNYEMAVTVLQDQLAWQASRNPDPAATDPAPTDSAATDPAIRRSRATLAMFYAQALVLYGQMYSFQVGQRERAPELGGGPGGPEVPFVNTLRAWTAEELLTQTQLALGTAWEQRAALGQQLTRDLPEYVEPGTSPTDARPTLRDLLTYQYAEFLANRTRWRVDQKLGVPVSEVVALGRLDGTQATTSRLLDAQVHPLTKLAAVLGDLLAWHQAAGRSTAAGEAQLERLVRLHQAFADEARRALVRAQLAELVQTSGALPHGAAAQATLAELLRSDFYDHPDLAAADQLTQAYAVAVQAAQRFPDAPGGKRCRALSQALTAAEFRLASGTAVATGTPRLQVVHRNLPALHFRAYKYDPVERLLAGTADEPDLTPRELASALRSGKPVAAWTTPLPATPDLQQRVTLVPLPLEQPGNYLVIGSERADFATANNHLGSVRWHSDLILWATAEPSATRVTAVQAPRGEPLPGVELTLYRLGPSGSAAPRSLVKLGPSVRTGPDGSVELPYRSAVRDCVIVGRRGAQVAVVDGVPQREPERRSGGEPTVLLYTDSRVYRPQQKVLWKLVAYRTATATASPRPLPTTPIGVTLLDADFQRVGSRSVTTNQFGTASGELTIPPGRRPGPWKLTTAYGGESTIHIEEPLPPRLTVTLRAPESAPRLGQPAVLRGTTHYPFGAPVKNGQVRWQVVRQLQPPQLPWEPEPPGPIRQPAATLVATGQEAVQPDGTFLIRFTPEAPAQTAQTPRREPPTYHFQVTAELTDDSGETGVAQHELHLAAAALRAELQPEREFLLSGQPAALQVTRRDLAGNPAPGAASWRLLRLSATPRSEPAASQAERAGVRDETAAEPAPGLMPMAATSPALQPADPTPPVTTPGAHPPPRELAYAPLALLPERPDGPELTHGELTHGADGLATLRLDALPAGAYRLHYQSRDVAGQTYQTARELLVVPGPGAGPTADTLGLPALLLRERPLVAVGDTARFAVASAMGSQALFLEIHRTGLVTERRRLYAGKDPLLLEIPVQPRDRGGITVTLTTVLGNEVLRLEQSIGVPWDDHALLLELASFRDRLRPGARQTLRITAKTADGRPSGPTELLAYMYDRRLTQLAADPPPDLLRLYPAEPPDPTLAPRFLHSQAIGTADAAIGESPVLMDGRPRPDRLRLSLNYRLGELASSRQGRLTDRTEPSSFPAALHPDFAATAFFRPHLLLSPAGAASVEFTVPDTTTPWNVFVAALTPDLRVGTLTRPVQSLKELSVQPQIPPFLREGDRAELSVVVSSAATRILTGQVKIELFDPATGADLRPAFGLPPSSASSLFRLTAGAQTALRFAVTAPPLPLQAAVRITATAEALSDSEQRMLPILPARPRPAPASAATPQARDVIGTTVAAALPYLAADTDSRVDSLVSRFLATSIVAATRKPDPALPILLPARLAPSPAPEKSAAATADRQLVQDETPGLTPPSALPDGDAARLATLAALRQAQTESGGFALWPGGPPSPYWTLYVVYRLGQAAELGAEVPLELVRNAWWYLGDQLRERYVKRGTPAGLSTEFLTFLNYAAAMAPSPRWFAEALSGAERQQLLQQSRRSAGQLSPLGLAQLALTLKQLGQPDEATRLLLTRLDTAKTTAEQGTYLAPAAQPWLWSSDPVEGHALVLRALLELMPVDPRLPGLLQWLLQQKQGSQWKSARTTAEAVHVLCIYLKSRGATATPQAAVTPSSAPPVPPRSALFVLGRRYYLRTPGPTPTLQPITEATVVSPGDQIEVQLTLRSQEPSESIQLRDPRPAGLEPIGAPTAIPRLVFAQSLSYYQELRPSSTSFFFEELPAGQYSFSYRLRASVPGTFRVPPATAQPLATPEFSAASPPTTLTIKPTTR